MKLSELEINKMAVIENINCDSELRRRFYSFGIIKGATIFIENISFAKNTMEINVEDTSIGLRVEEANFIEVTLKNTKE
ncbi:MAG: FeoA family protein [Campylobacterota bacterium]|nr:FeoA family protein [Campylobacterota bacterium]